MQIMTSMKVIDTREKKWLIDFLESISAASCNSEAPIKVVILSPLMSLPRCKKVMKARAVCGGGQTRHREGASLSIGSQPAYLAGSCARDRGSHSVSCSQPMSLNRTGSSISSSTSSIIQVRRVWT